MQPTALGHRLETLHDGLTTFRDGEPVAVPLVATTLSVRVVSGLAFVRTTRSFRNAEENPIEAVLTFPVGFDAVVTGLAATIDGRRMIGVSKERAEARETYEVNRPGFTGGQNSRRIARYGTCTKEEDVEAVFTRVPRTRGAAFAGTPR